MPAPRRSARVASREEPAAKKAKPEPKSTGLQIGDKLPELTLLNENEEEVDIGKIGSQAKYVVIFTYPKASTGGCTKQARGFAASKDDFAKHDAVIYGLSTDSPKAQKNFITKQELNFVLLSDPQRKLIGPLGASKLPSGTKRLHFIFEDGVLKVSKVQVSPQELYEGALADVETFANSGNSDNSEVKSEQEPEGDSKTEDADDADEKPAEKELASEESPVKDDNEPEPKAE